MTKQEQIEEIVHIICGQYRDGICAIDKDNCDKSCSWTRDAEAIYNAGYRKIDDKCAVITKDDLDIYKKQACKEIVKEIMQGLESMANNGVYQGKLTVQQMRIFFKEHYVVEVEE